MTDGGAPGRLLGREGELEALRTFLTPEAGTVAALVLEGPAWVGKTTLWEYGVALGRGLGLRVLVSRASGAETGLAFTTLVDLLDGMEPDALGFDDQAGAGLAAAAAAYERLRLGLDAARTTLVLGRAQRRARKWGAASGSLDAAATAFTAMGSTGWADQARAERARAAPGSLGAP